MKNLRILLPLLTLIVFIPIRALALGGNKGHFEIPDINLWSGNYLLEEGSDANCLKSFSINAKESEIEDQNCPLNINYSFYGATENYKYLIASNINCGLKLSSGWPIGEKRAFEDIIIKLDEGQKLISKSGYKKNGFLHWESIDEYSLSKSGSLHLLIKVKGEIMHDCKFKKSVSH